MPFGAELVAGGARFRLWAPDARRVVLRLEGPGAARDVAMQGGDDGWFAAVVPGAHAARATASRSTAKRWCPIPPRASNPRDSTARAR